LRFFDFRRLLVGGSKLQGYKPPDSPSGGFLLK